MERFSCKTQIISGAGSVAALAQLHPQRLLMVTDPYFFKNGTAQQIAALSQAREVSYFHKVAPDPTVSLAAEGTAQVQAFQPDTIVALGGGSAMDCAKAMTYFSGTNAKLAAIPTTSGSGSEVTDFAILTHNGVKHPLVDDRLQPDIAILDSDLLNALPKSLIADAGFDILSHALEARVATGAGAVTDALAERAFRDTMLYLPRSFRAELSARPVVHMAATMAGMAFTQAGLGLCHAIAHSLGGEFHIPHGRLNAILLPSVISRNAAAAGNKYAAIARTAGFSGTADTVALRNLRSALIRLRRELELPATLIQAGASAAELRRKRDTLVEAALADPCCKTNPLPVTQALIRDILDEVTGYA